MISKATKTDSFQIANLHYKTISEGFLIKLGLGFLKTLYQFIIINELVITYKDNDQVLGFVSCTKSSKGIMKRFLVSSPEGIVKIGIELIKKPKLLKSIWETFKAPSRSASDNGSGLQIPETELLSISVSPTAQKEGIGSQLLIALEEELKSRGIFKYKVIAGEKLQGANKFYLKNGFILTTKIQIHGDELSNVYIKTIIN